VINQISLLIKMISYCQNDNAFVQRVKQEKTSAQN
jgi:hypothetical protein